jgi:hypothetical protein
MANDDRKRQLAAQRARRLRQRRSGRNPVRVVSIEVDLQAIEAMIDAGMISEKQSEDPKALSRAATAVFQRGKYSVTRDAHMPARVALSWRTEESHSVAKAHAEKDE